jgi:hypothetical protein
MAMTGVVLAACPLFAQAPAGQAPAQQAQAAPAARVFASDAGMVLNFIKPDKTADFEAVMAKLKEALQKSEKPERKQQAASWQIFKAVRGFVCDRPELREPDARAGPGEIANDCRIAGLSKGPNGYFLQFCSPVIRQFRISD